jgi:hypothetical protein
VHPKHPKKEVNEALDYADKQGLRVERTLAGHKWGRIRCSCGAFFSIWSTPQSPHDHGRQVRRWVDQHQHDVEEVGL